jgi:hypothetical protein
VSRSKEVIMADNIDNNNTNTQIPSRPEYMLTTVDNPYDPFTQWDEWFAWDLSAGYGTPGLLARVTRTSDDLSESDQHLAIQQAIDEIVQENVLGVFKKVKEGEMNVS